MIRVLDLELSTGVFGLLGPNGAGKTTLLRTIATALPPLGGELELFGWPVSSGRQLRAARRRIGFLPQSFAFPPEFSVSDFVSYCAWLREVPHDQISAAATEAISRVGLEAESRTKMRKISGGMLRRAGIAQAIVANPALVVLDEPTTGLDPLQRTQFRHLLRELSRDTCVILSTHLVEDVAHTADRVGILSGGDLVYDGSLEDLAGAAGSQHPGDTELERGYAGVLTAAGIPRQP